MANQKLIAMLTSILALQMFEQAPPDNRGHLLFVIEESRIKLESIKVPEFWILEDFFEVTPTFADAYIPFDQTHLRLPRPNGGQKGAALAHLARDDVDTGVFHGACCSCWGTCGVAV